MILGRPTDSKNGESPETFPLDKCLLFAKAIGVVRSSPERLGPFLSQPDGRESTLNSSPVEINGMEKRSFTRIPFQAKALVRAKDITVIGVVENLSLDGIFLKTPEKLRVNRVVKIELLFTGTSSQLSILLNGKILRHENIGMAIQFRKIDLDAFFHLNNLISYNTDEIDRVKKEFEKFTNKQDRKN